MVGKLEMQVGATRCEAPIGVDVIAARSAYGAELLTFDHARASIDAARV
jgi:hypothetical protein